MYGGTCAIIVAQMLKYNIEILYVPNLSGKQVVRLSTGSGA